MTPHRYSDEHSVSKCFEILNIYCSSTGAKVNTEKSGVLVINGWIDTLYYMNLPLVIQNDFVEILEVTVGKDVKICENIK